MKKNIQILFPELDDRLPSAIAPADAQAYLTDESRMTGYAYKIFSPCSENDVVRLVRRADSDGVSLTVSGGRTGITGGAVPQGGWLMSTERLLSFNGLRNDPADPESFLLRCAPGLTLNAVNDAVLKAEFPGSENWSEADRRTLTELRRMPPHFFPPDPTEQTATIGGMVACNASGARTLHYGPTREFITALRIALADGSILNVPRGKFFAAADGSFVLTDDNGNAIHITIPDYHMPDVKNAAGYFSKPGMDLIDLFIGAEGTLGFFTEIEIRIVPAPPAILGAVAFFPSETNAVQFVNTVRSATDIPSWQLLALEFFDANALDLLRDQKKRLGAGSPIPAMPDDADTAIYIEISTNEDGMENTAETLLAMLESAGADPDAAWSAMDEDEILRLKNFRHALPETINQRIGERAAKYPGLTKLGTDFAVPDKSLSAILQTYHSALKSAGFEYVIFGHIGNNHLHVNILPRDLDEYNRGKELYLRLARAALDMGGTVSAEHGIGKIKKPLLRLMFGDRGIESMRGVKISLDPHGRLNPGNMF